MNYIRSSSDSSVKAVRRKTLTAIIMAVMTSLSAFSFHGCSMDENKTAEESSVSTAVTETSAAQSLCSTSETDKGKKTDSTSEITTSPVTTAVTVTSADSSLEGKQLSDSYKELFPAKSIEFSFMKSGYHVYRSEEDNQKHMYGYGRTGSVFYPEVSEPQLLDDSETELLNNYFTSHDLVEVNGDFAKLISEDMKFSIYVPEKDDLAISFYRNRKLVKFADENGEHVYRLDDAEQLDALYDMASQYESNIFDQIPESVFDIDSEEEFRTSKEDFDMITDESKFECDDRLRFYDYSLTGRDYFGDVSYEELSDELKEIIYNYLNTHELRSMAHGYGQELDTDYECRAFSLCFSPLEKQSSPGGGRWLTFLKNRKFIAIGNNMAGSSSRMYVVEDADELKPLYDFYEKHLREVEYIGL